MRISLILYIIFVLVHASLFEGREMEEAKMKKLNFLLNVIFWRLNNQIYYLSFFWVDSWYVTIFHKATSNIIPQYIDFLNFVLFFLVETFYFEFFFVFIFCCTQWGKLKTVNGFHMIVIYFCLCWLYAFW